MLHDAIDERIFVDFTYKPLLEKMVKYDLSERFQTFSEIQENMIESGTSYENLFTYEEKQVYQIFITDLSNAITEIDSKTKYKTDVNRMIVDLENIYRSNVLEDTIQNTRDITRVFLNGSYRFYLQPRFRCYNLK